MPLLQHIPITISIEIERLPEMSLQPAPSMEVKCLPKMSLQPAPSILQIEEALYAPFKIQLGDKGYHLFKPNNELNI